MIRSNHSNSENPCNDQAYRNTRLELNELKIKLERMQLRVMAARCTMAMYEEGDPLSAIHARVVEVLLDDMAAGLE